MNRIATLAYFSIILFAMNTFGAAVIFQGSNVKALKQNLDLNGVVTVQSGSVDPSSVSTSANKGSLYLSTNGNAYCKQDSGNTTNWNRINGLFSLNNQTQPAQTFANDTNVTLTSTAGTHALGWTGFLSLSRGGTGAAVTGSAGGIVYGSSTTTMNMTVAGTAGQILVSGGASAPTWSAPLFTPGTNNLVLGPGNLGSLTSGNQNSIFGYGAGTAITSGSNNLFFGFAAGQQTSSGSLNTFIGASSGSNHTTQSNNTAVGYNSDIQGTGSQNTFFGSTTGPQGAGAGSNNAGFGYGAGNALTSGARNSFFGQQTGNATNTHNDNTFFGYQAGFTCNQDNNTIVGSSSDCGANTHTNVLVLGKGITTAASNEARIGNSTQFIGFVGATPSTSAFGVWPAGTTSVAPLRFTAGTNVTSAVSGNWEYDGTQLYFTNSTPTRQKVLKTPDAHTNGAVVYSDGTDARLLAIGTTGQILSSNGGAAPTWKSYTNPTFQTFTSTGTTTGWLFTISTSTTCAVGDTYTNNSHTYTVLGALSSQSGQVLFMSGALTPQSSGTLSRATGSGTSSITFSFATPLATYTLPANPSPIYIKITVVGGGGGGASGGIGPAPASAGVASFFGANILSATGGGAGAAGGGGANSGGSATVNSPAITIFTMSGSASMGGSNNNTLNMYMVGGMGGSTCFGGNGGSGGAGAAGAAGTGFGAGGGGGGANPTTSANNMSGSGGGGGGCLQATINSPAASYPYVVGTGGGIGSAGTNGFQGAAGANGVVIVEEYYQ